jgi:hypothetical protein
VRKYIASQIISDERQREKGMWQSWVATPILFYGKVVDDKGNPISDADVLISFGDALGAGEDTKIEKKTDSSGLFVADGHGIAVVLTVAKKGYYTQDASGGTFGYIKGGNFAPHADPSNPAIFILRKMGQTERLIATSIGGRLNKDGTPFYLSLQTAKKVNDGQGDLKIQCWTDDGNVKINTNESFDWRCRISVNGGLIERRGDFDFQVPEVGYRPSIEFNMPKAAGDNWRDSITGDYFVKLENGMYGRIQLTVNAGGAQIFYINGYLNPKRGSRNLESGELPK